MKIILLLFVITILNGCAILAIKETARVTDIIDCIKMVVYCD